MAQNWSTYCNKRAYGQNGSFVDNAERVEMKSGRVVTYRKNSVTKKEHALNFTFDDSAKVDGYTEFEHFLQWYDETLRSGTEAFYFPDVITHGTAKLYKIKDSPSWTGQKHKEVSLTFVED